MPALRLRVPQWTRTVQGGAGRRRWFAVGRSTDPDSRRAGAYATARALVAGDPALLIVWCSGSNDPGAVLAGVASVAGGVPVIGCSAETLLSPDGPGGGVVVTALGGSGLSVSTTVERGVANRQRDAGAAAARCALPPSDRPHQVLLIFTSGDTASQEEILAGAYSVVGAGVPIVGGTASPCPAVKRPFTLYDRQMLTDSVVAASISSDGPLAIGVRHGFHRVGAPMIVTSSSGGVVRSLDDRRALPAYLDRLGAPAPAYVDPAAFEKFAVTHPVGLRRRTELELRDVSGSEHLREGNLHSIGDIPEGGMLWLMAGDQEASLAAAEEAGRTAVAGLGDVEPIGVLAFDCSARGSMLGEAGMREEVERLSAAVDGAPVAGYYTWGEIARTRGTFGYHNQTLVVLALG